MINHLTNDCKRGNQFLQDKGIAKFIRFLKRIGVKKMLSGLTDPREESKRKYSQDSLLLWALSVFFFRQGSKNALDTTIRDLRPNQKEAFLKYLGIEEDAIPHRTTIDDYLCRIHPDEVNGLLSNLFSWCQKNKLFYNHSEKLLPHNFYHIGSDGVWVHTYDAPHVVDEKGNNACPYCLSRTINKGTEKEKTYWVHM